MIFKREGDQTKVVHSPAMCNHKGETFLTFYQCHHEGWTQEVVVLKKSKNKWVEILKLPKGTGNPVLLSVKDKLYLCYSKFKAGTERVRNVLFLWKNVDMFVAEISNADNNGGDKWFYKDVAFFQNLCPRVSALKVGKDALLPVYDEFFACGYVIMFHVSNNKGKDNYTIARHSMMHSRYIPFIQPCLYFFNDNMCFEGRNFGHRGDYAGIHGEWNRNTGTWGIERRTDFNNFRESVLLFSSNDILYRVWGAERNRTELSIAKRGDENFSHLKLNKLQHGCYPNYLINDDNTFTICFTEYSSRLSENTVITMVTLDKNFKILNKESV